MILMPVGRPRAKHDAAVGRQGLAAGGDVDDHRGGGEVDVAIATGREESEPVRDCREAAAFAGVDDDDEALMVARREIDRSKFAVSGRDLARRLGGLLLRNPGVSGGISSGRIGSPAFFGAAATACVETSLSRPWG